MLNPSGKLATGKTIATPNPNIKIASSPNLKRRPSGKFANGKLGNVKTIATPNPIIKSRIYMNCS